MTQRYGVWCEVWGGLTGYRASWLKSNGTLQVFDSALAATAVAERMMETSRVATPSKARYTVRPMPDLGTAARLLLEAVADW